MQFCLQILGILAGLLLPFFLVRALKTDHKETETNYTALSGVCLAYIVYILIASFQV